MRRTIKLTYFVQVFRRVEDDRWESVGADCDGDADFDTDETFYDPAEGTYAQVADGAHHEPRCAACVGPTPCHQRCITAPATGLLTIIHEYKEPHAS